jgi:hypothetical protein
VFRVEVAWALESALVAALESAQDSAVWVGWAEVHLFLCVSSVSADHLQCYFGKEGIWESGFDEA